MENNGLLTLFQSTIKIEFLNTLSIDNYIMIIFMEPVGKHLLQTNPIQKMFQFMYQIYKDMEVVA